MEGEGKPDSISSFNISTETSEITASAAGDCIKLQPDVPGRQVVTGLNTETAPLPPNPAPPMF